MPTREWIRLAELVAAFLLALAVFFSWRADRRDRSQLESELAATKQLLAAADTRQHDRDAQLAQTLATLAAEKRTNVTPAQIVHDLPTQLPLPSPLVLQSAPSSPDSPTPKTNAASPAPPSGSSSVLPPELSLPKPPTSSAPLRFGRFPRV